MNQVDLLARYGVPQYRAVRITDYSAELAETDLRVWVNAPAIVEKLRVDAGELNLPAMRAAVAIWYGEPNNPVPNEIIANLDDVLIMAMFRAATDAYTAYHEELKKK